MAAVSRSKFGFRFGKVQPRHAASAWRGCFFMTPVEIDYVQAGLILGFLCPQLPGKTPLSKATYKRLQPPDRVAEFSDMETIHLK
ncbi:hypothetical protein [Niveispirillum lacus]|uniref:hypothetical protein n=1 Tax=Niveispirillum lacus TaxID=1981099 RepID=UPI0010569D15|nr:hypothetical protein [Niveispirillum lacus]